MTIMANYITGSYTGTTVPGYTETDEGMIPHREVLADCGMILAPVCIQRTKNNRKPPRVARNGEGQMLYALPGGGRMPA